MQTQHKEGKIKKIGLMNVYMQERLKEMTKSEQKEANKNPLSFALAILTEKIDEVIDELSRRNYKK